jgi:hypothetical protein
MWRAGAPSAGSCLVLPANSNEDYPLPAFKDYAAYNGSTRLGFLDAGDTLNLTASPGARKLYRVNSQYWGFLGGLDLDSGPTPPFLEAGTYTIDNGSGGKDVGEFKATLAVGGALAWSSEAGDRTIPRDRDLTISWASSDPDKELITIIGVSGNEDGMPTALICTERASAGSFTIPSWVLSAVLSSEIVDGIPLGLLTLIRSPLDSLSLFTAPGLDSGRLQFVEAHMKNVEFR